MSALNDPFDVLVIEEEADEFARLSRRPAAPVIDTPPVGASALTARLHGFSLEDRPLVARLPGLPGEIVEARTSVPLRRAEIGSDVVVLCEQGDVRRPIIVGVLQEQRSVTCAESNPPQLVSVQVDDDRLVLSAKREIVLRCGDASITLTRAGKVIIKGGYIISRSTGCNKIKGAAVDIN